VRRDEPADLGAQHIGKSQGQPREGPVQLAQQLVLGRGAGQHPAGPVRRPGLQGTDDLVLGGERDPAPGQDQRGDRVQVDSVGLDPPPPLDSALFGDVCRVELEHLPPRRPGRAEHRPVIVTRRLNPDLHQGTGVGQHFHDPLHHRRQRRSGHRELDRTQQSVTSGIGHRQRHTGLADIDGNDNC
jgi:hypothetical protein